MTEILDLKMSDLQKQLFALIFFFHFHSSFHLLLLMTNEPDISQEWNEMFATNNGWNSTDKKAFVVCICVGEEHLPQVMQ